MKWVRDLTGRFAERPHYLPEELDAECERILGDFQQVSTRQLKVPVETDELTKLVETHAADLDLYADLSIEGADVEGVTLFIKNEKPRVLIARELSDDPRRENRLRTTLTHELGHVKFHAFIWELKGRPSRLFEDMQEDPSPKCRRGDMTAAPAKDWMEWQAGYVCGSLLMPVTAFSALVAEYFQENDVYGAVVAGSLQAEELIRRVAAEFQVSHDAAKVRLSKLGKLTQREAGPVLF